MSLIARELQGVWEALGAGNGHRDDALAEVRIRNLRGIRDLRVPFDYPVYVLAGSNGCGKSTVLLACACAYRVPGRGPREFVPSTLFPNFVNRQQPEFSDLTLRTEIEFHYLHHGERLSMLWRRGKSWGRSFLGRKGGAQPSGMSTCERWPTSPTRPTCAASCNSPESNSRPARSARRC